MAAAIMSAASRDRQAWSITSFGAILLRPSSRATGAQKQLPVLRRGFSADSFSACFRSSLTSNVRSAVESTVEKAASACVLRPDAARRSSRDTTIAHSIATQRPIDRGRSGGGPK
jgi:hypothetical protein